MALLQGVTELFPISSLGHAVIFPRLVGWGDLIHRPDFLPYLVVMHLGTAVALFVFSGATGWRSCNRRLKADTPRAIADRRIFLFVMLATIPAVIVGAALEHKLLRGGVLQSFAGRLRADPQWRPALFLRPDRRARCRRRSTSSTGRARSPSASRNASRWCPGFSRSGLTIAAGIIAGLKHEDAARFSFLMAMPIILGATVLEAPKLLHPGSGLGVASLISGVTAGVIAYGTLVVLMRWFRGHEFNALKPFAYYCAAAGLVSLALMLVI